MTIAYAHKLGFDNPIMHEYMANQILFVLPTPILNALGIHINKFELQYTPGDLLSMESLNIGDLKNNLVCLHNTMIFISMDERQNFI